MSLLRLGVLLGMWIPDEGLNPMPGFLDMVAALEAHCNNDNIVLLTLHQEAIYNGK